MIPAKYNKILTISSIATFSGLIYGGLFERNNFKLRKITQPLLPSGSLPLKILHLSDLHIRPNQTKKIEWIAKLAQLNPDLVINTGDNLAHPKAVPHVIQALEGLLAKPGVFVFGSNDYFAPKFKNPLTYFRKDTSIKDLKNKIELPWTDLRAVFIERGWHDLTNKTSTLNINNIELIFSGVDDPHIHRENMLDWKIAGLSPTKPYLKIGITHSPESRVLKKFNELDYQIVFAGHTHGGQIRFPGCPALVTNCDLPGKQAKGLSKWGNLLLHVSAGLGTSPYAPIRFACPPEATLITII